MEKGIFISLVNFFFCGVKSDADAHTTDDVDYKWRKTKSNKGKGIEIASQEMAQFELAGIETKIKDTENSKGIQMSFFFNAYVLINN